MHLVLEVKGYRGEDAKAKKDTMDTYWVPGVNAHGCYGRWAFVELRDVHTMQDDLAAKLEEELVRVIECASADGFVPDGRETGLPSKQQYVS